MSIEELRHIKVRAHLESAFREQLMSNPWQFLQEYDLTEDEKRQIILPNFSWLFENKLAAMPYPESEDAFTLLYEKGIRAVLNLAERPYSYETPARIGMLTRHIPVPDFTAPTLHQAEEAVAVISSCLDNHAPLAVHCMAGLGRTGTILACYLVSMEMPANNAIVVIREWRPGSIETLEQEAVVYAYERFLGTDVQTVYSVKEKSMLDRAAVQRWLDNYVSAWKSYDPQAIGDLFSENAVYAYNPFSEPVQGRAAIVASWLEEPDTAGTYDGHYEPIMIEGDRAVANGHSLYFEPDGTTLKAEWNNIFLLRFDADGRCSEFREWYMQRKL